MPAFKNVLVGLDITKMDEKLIEYTAFLSKLIQPEKVCFLHVQHDPDLPESIRQTYPVLSEAPDEQIRQRMEAQVQKHFSGSESTVLSFVVTAGVPSREILREAGQQQSDLLIVGGKREGPDKGMTPQHLAHKAPCSLLFIPQDAPARIGHILVATDFSPHSRRALAHAQAIARAVPGAVIRCQHVYSVPHGYFKTGLTEPEFAAVMHKNAADDYEGFIASFPEGSVTGEPLFTYNAGRKSPAVAIHEAAHRLGADLVVAGARGLNAAAAFFLGSVADKLIQLDRDIPLLIVKNES